MSDESPSVDARSRKLVLEMMGEHGQRELAAGIDDRKTGKELMASLLGQQIVACYRLSMRFDAMANAFLDRAGPGSASGDGERNALTSIRLSNTAARLMERCRAGMLALEKLRRYEPHD